MNRLSLPTVFGAPVRWSGTWAVVTLSLGAVSAYLLFPQSGTTSEIIGWLIGAVVLATGIVLSLIVHDFGHIWVARRTGATLDAFEPAIVGALPDTCFTPGSPENDLRVAGAGPILSLLLALICGGIWLAAQSPGSMPGVALLLLGGFNLGLMALNLLPGYPFDGGRIFRAFMWYLHGDLVGATRAAAAYGHFFLLAGFLTGMILLSVGESYALWGAWVLLLCWSLNRARTQGMTQTVWREAGRRLQIDDLFQAGVNRVPASATIDDSIESLLDNYRRGPTLVSNDAEIVGVVDLHSFRKVPRASWTHMTVGDVMSPIDTLPRLESTDSVTTLLAELPDGSTKVILVQRDGKIVAAADRAFVLERVQGYINAERVIRPRRQ